MNDKEREDFDRLLAALKTAHDYGWIEGFHHGRGRGNLTKQESWDKFLKDHAPKE